MKVSNQSEAPFDPASNGPGAALCGSGWGMGVLAGLVSALLWVLSIPPFDFAEAAYVAFVPLLLWLSRRPSSRVLWAVGLGTGWLAWFVILIWLRHVTFLGTVGLAGVLGLLFVIWLRFVLAVLPGVECAGFARRIAIFGGVAGAWVVLEWSRTWLLWGFPWAPLSLSQWERPVVLQIAAWTGAYGVSFLLVLFNLCVAQTLRVRIFQSDRRPFGGWFGPDLYLALGLLAGCIGLFFKVLPEAGAGERLFTAAVVQPYIPPDLKWDEGRELENLEILERHTRRTALLDSDVILWPEAATPWPIVGFPKITERVWALSKEVDKPILMGNLALIRETDAWYNGAFLMNPRTGLVEAFYSKRELVPFGEYVPGWLRFIEKVVPVGGDFIPGTDPGLIDLELGERTHRIGPLVCYEDVFPHLARESAAAGAEVFFVATNNAWYGEEGGAEQHAAHSVLRAVENRRPVMRAGNGGWSGWIDAYGTVQKVLVDERGSVYFRGGDSYEVFQYGAWGTRQTFYTRHGDYFVGLCAVFAIWAGLFAFRGWKMGSPVL